MAFSDCITTNPDGTVQKSGASTGAAGLVLDSNFDILNSRVPSAAILADGSVGLDNCTGLPESGVLNLTTDLAALAPLASAALTGTPTAPTATSGTNTTQLATTAFVQTANATNANLTGPITSSGNATAIASGVTITSPTITTPTISGTATASAIKPASDSTTAIQIFQADGTTPVVVVDSTNKQIVVGTGTTMTQVGQNFINFYRPGPTYINQSSNGQYMIFRSSHFSFADTYVFQYNWTGVEIEKNLICDQAILSNIAPTTVTGSTSGNAYCTMPSQGSADKQVNIQCVSVVGSVTYTYPTAFSYVPYIDPSNPNYALITSISTTSVTITAVSALTAAFIFQGK